MDMGVANIGFIVPDMSTLEIGVTIDDEITINSHNTIFDRGSDAECFEHISDTRFGRR